MKDINTSPKNNHHFLAVIINSMKIAEKNIR